MIQFKPPKKKRLYLLLDTSITKYGEVYEVYL